MNINCMFKHICVHTCNTVNDNVLLSHVVKNVEEIVLLEKLMSYMYMGQQTID